MPGPEWWRQEVGIRGAEAAGGSVVVEQVVLVRYEGAWLTIFVNNICLNLNIDTLYIEILLVLCADILH